MISGAYRRERERCGDFARCDLRALSAAAAQSLCARLEVGRIITTSSLRPGAMSQASCCMPCSRIPTAASSSLSSMSAHRCQLSRPSTSYARREGAAIGCIPACTAYQLQSPPVCSCVPPAGVCEISSSPLLLLPAAGEALQAASKPRAGRTCGNSCARADLPCVPVCIHASMIMLLSQR